jgi:hypothetical protein
MTGRPAKTWVYHIKHVDLLPSLITNGLCSDRLASQRDLPELSIAHSHLKQRRARRQVPIPPGGTLDDYVPFYFAPRSPMLFAKHKGNVAGQSTDCTPIVYLVTTTEELHRRGLTILGTDRHALMSYARFTGDDNELTTFVDWPLMQERMWKDEPNDPDKCERRQAELLVHQRVPWDSIRYVATKTPVARDGARAMLESHGASTPLLVRPRWYF